MTYPLCILIKFVISSEFQDSMSEICIEKKNFYLKKVLDTIFRFSKSLELTPRTTFYVQNAQWVNDF